MSASILARCFRWLVKATDAVLRRIEGVTAFESVDEGLLRIAVHRVGRDVVLPDGSQMKRGSPAIDLHLWNEHFPRFPCEEADFGWTARVQRQVVSSLHRLALYIRNDPALDGAQALRMTLSIAKQGQTSLLARLLLTAGFEPIAEEGPSMGCITRILDTLWVWLLTWTYNPRALIGWLFNRTRREFWISRARFFALYGAGPVEKAETQQL